MNISLLESRGLLDGFDLQKLQVTKVQHLSFIIFKSWVVLVIKTEYK